MSQQIAVNGNSSVIPLIEVYWSLVNKADKKFSKIRDLPYYERNRYETYFYKVFKVYTQLWKFQQENRQKLVEAGIKRWEIGEIASRIAQLYYGQYMRTSDSSYLSESYIFYEAILSREYFKEGLFQDINIANKQLRFLARFLMVCLVLARREMVYQLVDQLKVLIDECKRTFQEADFREWKLLVQEIVRFLKADVGFDSRPLRYSLVLDPHPDTIPNIFKGATNRNLRLRDAILSTYHYNEVKFSELTLDAFRVLQCLEWEPSGAFYQSSNAKIGPNGSTGAGRLNHPQNITDPTLPPNPRKTVLYHPSVTNFLAVLATTCEELPADGILLLYLSASGKAEQTRPPPFTGRSTFCAEELKDFQTHSICEDEMSTTPIRFPTDRLSTLLEQNKGEPRSKSSSFLYFGSRGNSPNCIYPSDLIPFTRRPLFIIIDSDSSKAFKTISGSEKGEAAALLLSPSFEIPPLSVGDLPRQSSGSLFTMFLTAPLQAFSFLIGISSSDINVDAYNEADKLLTTLLNDWGTSLASSETLHPVWAQIIRDPFLRRVLLRFMFCRDVLSFYTLTKYQKEYLPECLPGLPEAFSTSVPSRSVVSQISSLFNATHKFDF